MAKKIREKVSWKEEARLALAKELDTDLDEIKQGRYDDWGDVLSLADGRKEYAVFENEDEAEKIAIALVEADLEYRPETFRTKWLKDYIMISETDRRLIAQEEADWRVDDMTEEDVIEESDEAQEIQDKIDELIYGEGDYEDRDRKSLERELDEAIQSWKDQKREEEYEYIYDALEDPIEYFVSELGAYTVEDLVKQDFIRIDIEEASEDAVSIDGAGHFLALYDGKLRGIDGTDFVYVRTD